MSGAGALRLAEPEADALQAFAEGLPLGLVWVDGAGVITSQNQLAIDLLNLPAVRAAFEGLVAEVGRVGGCLKTTIDLGGGERVQLSAAPCAGGSVVALDRGRLERARAESGVLRDVIKAMAASGSKRDAITRAIAVVRGQLPLAQVACFEASGPEFRCEGAGGLRSDEQAAVVTQGARDCLLSIAWTQRRTLHIGELGRSTLKLPFEVDLRAAAVVLPTGAKTPRGLLVVCAPPEVLTEGSLRLLQGLADAIGAVTDVALLEVSTARAMEVATQRDRLATIGQLVAGVAHEINNPLAFLKSNLHSLKSELADLRELAALPPSANELEEIVSESIEGVSRIETIVQALKGTARRRDERVRFDCSRAIQEALTIFKGAKKSEVEIVAAIPLLPEVIGSPSALGQVVLNLLQNGLDAMGGVERKRRKLELRAASVDGRVRVSVRDHGTGIPVEVQKRMWDAFYTTKEIGKGTGLGLSICKEIVEEMGGWLEFETGPDGTVFHVVLPESDD